MFFSYKGVNRIIEPYKTNKKVCYTLARIKHCKKNPFIRNYSTVNNNNSRLELSPDFVSGFIDAEGSFTTVVYYKKRWCTNSVFKITLHSKDIELLVALRAFFGVGKISGSDYVSYRVESVKDIINCIIPHLDKYPLITQKKTEYELFKRIVLMTDKKLHLTDDGLQEIVNIKASMNKGVSEELLAEFPDTAPVFRPSVEVPQNRDIRPHWLAGFTAGDGCFFIYVEKDSNYRTGYHIKLRFNICQHLKDKLLMERIASYFNCGKVTETLRGEVNFDVHKFSDNYDIILPFFDKYPIHGVKALDLKGWKIVAELIKIKGHLTKEGVEKIIKIKSDMNKSREIS